VALTKEKSDRRIISLGAENTVDSGEVEVQLARVLRLEWAGFQLYDEVAVQPDVIEEQIKVEVLIADRQRHLATDEGKAPAQFQQQIAQMKQQTTFDLPFLGSLGNGEEVEVGYFCLSPAK
jgi:hypothetical protein